MPAVSVLAGEGTGRLHLVGRLCRRPDFVLSASVGALALALLYYGLLLRETTLHTMASKLSGQPIYVVALAVLAPAALVLFGANVGLAGLLLRARTRVHEQGGSLLGILIGAFSVGCPSCGAFLLSLVGVTAGLSVLPFAGLELWFLSGLIMAYTFWRSLGTLHAQTCTSTSAGACLSLPTVSRAQVAILTVAGVVLAGLLLWTMAAHESLSLFPTA
jgi:hypothetical protein